MSITNARPQQSILTRALRALPVIGWIARDMSKGVDNVFYALMILLTAVVLAVQVWGLVALVMTALFAVPVMFVLLIRLTIG